MTARTDRDARAELDALARRGVDLAAGSAAPRSPLAPERRRPAAVLMLFGRLDAVPADHGSAAVPADLDVLLVERARSLRQHPGQVAFPGGRTDPADDGPVGTALREAAEETGVSPRGVEILGTMPPVPVPASGHLVTPVLAWWARPTPVQVIDVRESAAVFRCPVGDLLDPANRYEGVVEHEATGVRVGPAFDVGGRIVWGFTGLLLATLFDELGWTEPWDDSRRLRIRR